MYLLIKTNNHKINVRVQVSMELVFVSKLVSLEKMPPWPSKVIMQAKTEFKKMEYGCGN